MHPPESKKIKHSLDPACCNLKNYSFFNVVFHKKFLQLNFP